MDKESNKKKLEKLNNKIEKLKFQIKMIKYDHLKTTEQINNFLDTNFESEILELDEFLCTKSNRTYHLENELTVEELKNLRSCIEIVKYRLNLLNELRISYYRIKDIDSFTTKILMWAFTIGIPIILIGLFIKTIREDKYPSSIEDFFTTSALKNFEIFTLDVFLFIIIIGLISFIIGGFALNKSTKIKLKLEKLNASL